MRGGVSLSSGFREHVRSFRHLSDGDGVVVGVSGGLDSTVLLHLLRFTDGLPDLRITAAHLDHRMRPDSGADAQWVSGLARAWNVTLVRETVAEAPASEEEGRALRYGFLDEVRGATQARWILTAHHADDVVETVLFRIARGTGIRGLRGIPEMRAPGVWRPLLPFHRDALEAYAMERGISWREDATNAGTDYARNVVRHRVVPALEAGVSPGTRKAVLRLARLARQDEDAWESLVPTLLAGVDAQHGEASVSVAREPLLAYHPAVRARVVRALARRLGRELDAAGTRVAVEFTSAGQSGRAVRLTGGLEFRRSLDRMVLDAGVTAAPGHRTLVLDGDAGDGPAVLAGAAYRVTWGAIPQSGTWSASFDVGEVVLPLHLRGWVPGDRVRMPYGTKKLKKLFLERRLPREARDRTPVLVDARGAVLWIPGVVRADVAHPEGAEHVLNVGVTHV